MTRKNNPWMSLVAMVLLAVILVWTCTGCTTAAAAAEDQPSNKWRFVSENCGDGCTIITDTQTGVQYLYHGSGYGGGLTALQPGEG